MMGRRKLAWTFMDGEERKGWGTKSTVREVDMK